MSEGKDSGETPVAPESDADEMSRAADEVWALAEKYGFTTRHTIKRVATALHDEARRLRQEE
jgi:hypothetical protein